VRREREKKQFFSFNLSTREEREEREKERGREEERRGREGERGRRCRVYLDDFRVVLVAATPRAHDALSDLKRRRH
jgi:hypothetical protein